MIEDFSGRNLYYKFIIIIIMKGKILKGGKPAMTIGFALAMVEGEGK